MVESFWPGIQFASQPVGAAVGRAVELRHTLGGGLVGVAALGAGVVGAVEASTGVVGAVEAFAGCWLNKPKGNSCAHQAGAVVVRATVVVSVGSADCWVILVQGTVVVGVVGFASLLVVVARLLGLLLVTLVEVLLLVLLLVLVVLLLLLWLLLLLLVLPCDWVPATAVVLLVGWVLDCSTFVVVDVAG